MVYRVIVIIIILSLIASNVQFAAPVTKALNQIGVDGNRSNGEDDSYYNEPISHIYATPNEDEIEDIITIDEDESIGQKVAKSTISSSSRTLNGWRGGFMSAREIDNLSKARDINVNVLSNINLAEIIRAYRGEPKSSNGAQRSGSWFRW